MFNGGKAYETYKEWIGFGMPSDIFQMPNNQRKISKIGLWYLQHAQSLRMIFIRESSASKVVVNLLSPIKIPPIPKYSTQEIIRKERN